MASDKSLHTAWELIRDYNDRDNIGRLRTEVAEAIDAAVTDARREQREEIERLKAVILDYEEKAKQ